jgi:hypothetical protein
MALQRKLTRLDYLKYIRQTCTHNYVGQILDCLEAGQHVVIEFGSQSNMLAIRNGFCGCSWFSLYW